MHTIRSASTVPPGHGNPPEFADSRDRFETVLNWLEGAEASALPHAELETRLQVESRELFRRLLQDHLDLRARREVRRQVVGADEVAARSRVEPGHNGA